MLNSIQVCMSQAHNSRAIAWAVFIYQFVCEAVA